MLVYLTTVKGKNLVINLDKVVKIEKRFEDKEDSTYIVSFVSGDDIYLSKLTFEKLIGMLETNDDLITIY